MTSHDLQANICRAAAGDRRAFEEIYDETIDTTYRLARCIIDDEGLLADCIRDVYIQAWRKASSWAGSPLSGRAWLMVMVQQHSYAVRDAACSQPPISQTTPVGPALLKVRMTVARSIGH